MTRTERLLALIQVLRRHRRPATGRELAEAMGVSVRTVYRDIATLIGQGAPIEGEAGVGFILRPGFLLPPLMFRDEEIEALVLFPVARAEVARDSIDAAVLRGAIRDERKLRLEYRDDDGRQTTRVVWPLAIGFYDRLRVLVAWCELRADFRHFRTDRIESAVRIDERLPRSRHALLSEWRAQEAAAEPPA